MSFPPAGVVTPVITFTDAIGAATVVGGYPRWSSWTPDAEYEGQEAVRLGSGITDLWIFRTDYTAALKIPMKRATDTATLLRLKLWLDQGGMIGITTNDLAGRAYVCVKMPKAKCKLAVDPQTLDYSLDLSLKNVGGSLAVATGPLATVGSTAAGASAIALGATALSGWVAPGDTLVIGATTYTVTAPALVAANAVTVAITPVTPGVIAASTAAMYAAATPGAMLAVYEA